MNFETWRSGNAPEDPLIYGAKQQEQASPLPITDSLLIGQASSQKNNTRHTTAPSSFFLLYYKYTIYTTFQAHLIMPTCL